MYYDGGNEWIYSRSWSMFLEPWERWEAEESDSGGNIAELPSLAYELDVDDVADDN